MSIGCANKIATNQLSIDSTIIQFQKMKKEKLPEFLNLSNEDQLIKFASRKLDFKKDRLKLVHYKHYIIIHFEDKEYESKHPKWKYKKYAEALVINKNTMLYTFFRFSRT